MKTIIAGSRFIDNEKLVFAVIWNVIYNHFVITEIVSGGCKGVDQLAERFALQNEIKKTRFPADWNTFGKRAGPLRNSEMAKYADSLILIWDGQSRGSKSMLNEARKQKLLIHSIEITNPDVYSK